MNVFQYVIPIFKLITAFAFLLGCNMTNQAALLYFASISSVFLYHYCQELLNEISLSVLERYYQTDILKHINFMRAFKDKNPEFIYTVYATVYTILRPDVKIYRLIISAKRSTQGTNKNWLFWISNIAAPYRAMSKNCQSRNICTTFNKSVLPQKYLHK